MQRLCICPIFLYCLGLVAGCETDHDDIREWGESKNTDRLLLEARYGNGDIQRAAIDALVNIGQPSVQPLAERLRGKGGSDSKQFAAEILVRIGRPSIPAVIAITDDKSFFWRKDIPHNPTPDEWDEWWDDGRTLQSAAWVLGKIGHSLAETDPRQATELLIRALRDCDPLSWGDDQVCEDAALVLVALHRKHGSSMLLDSAKTTCHLNRASREWLDSRRSWHWLSMSPELDVWAIEQAVQRDFAVHTETRQKLAEGGIEAAKALAYDYSKGTAEIPYAIRVLADRTGLEWSTKWVPHTSNPTTTAEEASKWLKTMRSQAVVPLIAGLRTKHEEFRRMIIRTLGKIGDARAVQPLFGALEDNEFLIREEAARALCQIDDTRAVEALIEAVRNERLPDYRAREVFREFYDTPTVEAVRRELTD